MDFKKIAHGGLNDINRILARWVPGGKQQGAEYIARNPARNDEREGSFSVNMKTGVWSDFATNDKGGDVISLVAYLEGVSQGDACQLVADFIGMSKAGSTSDRPPAARSSKTSVREIWTPVMPVPEEAKAFCPVSHSALGVASHSWDYLSGKGELLLRVLRFEVVDKQGRRKEYRPLTFCHSSKGAHKWQWRLPDNNRPLYGLEQLERFPGGPVLVCEGEKATDAARQLFPDLAAVTWLNGSKAIGKADFSPLAGRAVWYWPDNDEAGRNSIRSIVKALSGQGVASVAVFDLPVLSCFAPAVVDGQAALSQVTGAAQLPDKWDAADALSSGWCAGHMDLVRDKGLVKIVASGKAGAAGIVVPGGSGKYRSDNEGLFYFDTKTESYRLIGGRLDVVSRSRNSDNRSWGLLVSFNDMDGHSREWNIPSVLFATEGGAEVVRGLLDRGYTLLTNRDAKRHLIEYLGDFKTDKRVRLVERMGWFGNAFLLPDEVLGNPLEHLHYYSDAAPLCKMSRRGSLDEWRSEVAAHCVDNSLPTFAVCAAFAAPLLDILSSETCGFHFVGDSSLGKSTLLKIAASVYGDPGHYPRTWRSTDNALEATAAAHSDCLLVLDEIGQIDPRIVGETVYMLGNGAGKSRATENGRSRGIEHRWRLVFLSSGEKTLQDHMAEASKKPQAGMEARLLTIPANVHKDSADRVRLGIFESAKAFSGGAELSAYFMQCCERYHGEPIMEMIKTLTEARKCELVISWFDDERKMFKKTILDNGAGGQVKRAADKFAIVAAAGEWATEHGITGWPVGWASEAARICFRNWLAHRGGTGNLEDRQSIDHVRIMLSRYGESRFTRWDSSDAKVDEHAPRTMERWGFRKTKDEPNLYSGGTSETSFYLTATGFADMCTGHEPKRVARLLGDIEALETDKEPGRLTKKVRLPGGGSSPVNCYVIKLSVLLAAVDGLNSPEDYQSIE